jgi:predicted amidohydrolase YtcJ
MVGSLCVMRMANQQVRSAPCSPCALSGRQKTEISSDFRIGVFVDTAMDLIDNLKPPPTEVETFENFEITMRDALCVGLTSIHDAASLPSDIAFYRRHVLLPILFLALTCTHSARAEWPTKGVYPCVEHFLGARTDGLTPQ